MSVPVYSGGAGPRPLLTANVCTLVLEKGGRKRWVRSSLDTEGRWKQGSTATDETRTRSLEDRRIPTQSLSPSTAVDCAPKVFPRMAARDRGWGDDDDDDDDEDDDGEGDQAGAHKRRRTDAVSRIGQCGMYRKTGLGVRTGGAAPLGAFPPAPAAATTT